MKIYGVSGSGISNRHLRILRMKREFDICNKAWNSLVSVSRKVGNVMSTVLLKILRIFMSTINQSLKFQRSLWTSCSALATRVNCWYLAQYATNWIGRLARDVERTTTIALHRGNVFDSFIWYHDHDFREMEKPDLSCF